MLSQNRVIAIIALVGSLLGAGSASAQLQCITVEECLRGCSGPNTPCRIQCATQHPPKCDRTYYFCNFNTFAADWNFLELSAIGEPNQAVTGSLVALYHTGQSPVPRASWAFNLRGLQRQDVDIHSLVGKDQYGQVVIGIDGLVDSLNASISFYKATSTGDALQTVSVPCIKRDSSTLTNMP